MSELGFPSPAVTKYYLLFAGLLECTSRLVSWTIAVRNCEVDANRYIVAAKVILDDALFAHAEPVIGPFMTVAHLIRDTATVNDVPSVCEALLSVPLPISFPLTAINHRPLMEQEPHKSLPRPVVAFTSFSINGEPFVKNHRLNLNIGYDLEVTISLSHWPDGESELCLEPLSVEPSESYHLPIFSFAKPTGSGPYLLSSTKRMIIKHSVSFLARPMEFSYRATFLAEGSVSTEGQRHLTVRCFDPKSDPQSGYDQVDHKLIAIRDEARRSPGISDTELNNLLVLMGAIGGIAGQSLQDNLFPGVWKEESFQAELKRILRSRPPIGSELEEHPHVSAGITDLSFRHVRLELKAISDHFVTDADVQKFLPQIVQYVAGSDRRFGALCILDTFPKTSAPGSAADDISFVTAKGPSGRGLPLGIGVIIIRGNLSQPSSLRATPRLE